MRRLCPRCGSPMPAGGPCPKCGRPKRGPDRREQPYRRGYRDPEYEAMRQRVIARQRGRCASCGKACAEWDGHRWRTGRLGGQVHHIVPLSRGGSNTDTNAALLCEACHRRAHGGAR